MRGLAQSEGTSDSQTDLKATWNSWALKLCEAEGGIPHLRSKCLLQRTVLLLQQQMHLKALESAKEVLKLYPESKHAAALLATSQHMWTLWVSNTCLGGASLGITPPLGPQAPAGSAFHFKWEPKSIKFNNKFGLETC